MKLKLIMVASLDGVTNQGRKEDHHLWTSKEDQELFNNTRDNARLIIMGSKTYEGAKNFMEHSEKRLRIVLTKNPEKYASEKIDGQLEFANQDATTLLKNLESRGYTEGILVGGAHTNLQFLKENLVNEIWITIEPYLKGDGLHVASEKIDAPLQLLSLEKLNEKGTLLLKYSVLK